MTFFRGQKVCCIKRGAWSVFPHGQRPRVDGPSYGEVCEISGVHFQCGVQFLSLVGYDEIVGCSSRHFRPLVETKTDISIFERIRDRVNAKEIEEISDPVDVSFFAGHP